MPRLSLEFQEQQFMNQMRISEDVLLIARQEQARLGLRNPKEAIESMVRRFHRERQKSAESLAPSPVRP